MHSAPTGQIRDYVKDMRNNHMGMGEATCEAVNICDKPSDFPGTPCYGPNGEAGYCFETSTGPHSLMCGRLLALNNEYEQKPIAFDLPKGPHRCPRNAEVDAMGVYEVSRLLNAGCMASADLRYDPHAEIHVPEFCANATKDYGIIKGCMFPGAENFAPAAKQPTNCKYINKGCTNSLALNYNSEATMDDGSCIVPIPGCTLNDNGYSGVDSTTPSYQSLWYGSALRSVGKVDVPAYKAVTNYLPSANVLDGCVVAIEGCMDSTAANYEPKATINQYEWCIPVVKGCMMPLDTNANVGYSTTSAHLRQGLNKLFDPAVTVHDKSLCEVKYVGCMDTTAVNYNKDANVDSGDCWPTRTACLDPSADNFGCQKPGVFEKCKLPVGADRYTEHKADVCQFGTSPPFPPPPSFPPNTETKAVYTSVTRFKMTNPCTDEYKANLEASLVGIEPGKGRSAEVTCAVQNRRQRQRQLGAGGRRLETVTEVTARLKCASEEDAKSATASVKSQMGSWQKAESFLGAELFTFPRVTTAVTYDVISYGPAYPPGKAPKDDGGLSTGAIVGIVIGALVLVVIIIVLVIYFLKKGKKKSVEPNY